MSDRENPVMALLRRWAVLVVAAALVVAGAVTLLRSEPQRTVVAHFPRTVSIYEGSDVRVLGVPIGEVVSVEPSGTDVEVTMTYGDETPLPADATAVIVAPSVVGDRFVQFTPAYREGDEVLPDRAELPVERTQVPLELDQIYASLDQLSVALGPDGANSEGALSDLLAQTARNFGGQGEQFRQTIADFSRLTRTLDNNKEELFGSAARLQGFLETLADNDRTVRDFNRSIADVSAMLKGERQELTAALENLSVALTEVESFVRENRSALGSNIRGLNRVSKVLVRQRDAVDEILRVAPLALNNLAGTYNPQAGTLDTRANLAEVLGQLENDPALLLCTITNQLPDAGRLCDLIEQAAPRAGALAKGGAPEGGPVPARERFDPTLGGLVEVRR